VIVRVWLPDRPGALGQVASRIGAVRGDVIGLEILERGGGRAIDELVVDLHSGSHVALLIDEINHVDGVSVEHVRPIDGERTEPGLSALSLTASVAERRRQNGCNAWSGVSCASQRLIGPWPAATAPCSPLPGIRLRPSGSSPTWTAVGT